MNLPAATLLFLALFSVGCASTRVYSTATKPSIAIAEWKGPQAGFPTLVTMRLTLPDIGEELPAHKVVSRYQVLNTRAKIADKFYPANGKVFGAAKRISPTHVSLDLHFSTTARDTVAFPLGGSTASKQWMKPPFPTCQRLPLGIERSRLDLASKLDRYSKLCYC